MVVVSRRGRMLCDLCWMIQLMFAIRLTLGRESRGQPRRKRMLEPRILGGIERVPFPSKWSWDTAVMKIAEPTIAERVVEATPSWTPRLRCASADTSWATALRWASRLRSLASLRIPFIAFPSAHTRVGCIAFD